jgi:fibronectin type 3 domain-containing protein
MVAQLRRGFTIVLITVLAACGGGGKGSSDGTGSTPSNAQPTTPQPTESATLTWTPNTESDLAGYRVYRATSSGGYRAPIATVAPSSATYTATGLQPGRTYFFVVTAFDASGNESARSSEISKAF